jgi:hypothetical protein
MQGDRVVPHHDRQGEAEDSRHTPEPDLVGGRGIGEVELHALLLGSAENLGAAICLSLLRLGASEQITTEEKSTCVLP